MQQGSYIFLSYSITHFSEKIKSFFRKFMRNFIDWKIFAIIQKFRRHPHLHRPHRRKSFFLSHILCILLPAYLCYALRSLYNYISLSQVCYPCRYNSYTDVYLYLSAFPDSQLFLSRLLLSPPAGAGGNLCWLVAVIQCQRYKLIYSYIFSASQSSSRIIILHGHVLFNSLSSLFVASMNSWRSFSSFSNSSSVLIISFHLHLFIPYLFFRS